MGQGGGAASVEYLVHSPMIRYGMVWYGMVWYGSNGYLVHSPMIRYGGWWTPNRSVLLRQGHPLVLLVLSQCHLYGISLPCPALPCPALPCPALPPRQSHFQRVILMSGSIFSGWARVDNPAEVSILLLTTSPIVMQLLVKQKKDFFV